MHKNNKYLYGWKISVNYGYGHGWEVECFEEDYTQAKLNLRLYRKNMHYPVRMTQGREENPYYKAAK